ncbi:MAG: ABC transporter ATP-binding protein [Actinomycetota bacterium]|nr:ABC transporter ATP-binding protein [Actinomycetota bacterium]
MLLRLLRAYLRPYRRAILAVVVLQLGSTLATLYLPTLNADIIDNGVVAGNTGYILSNGGVMLAVSFGQILCSIGAVFYGARTAMALGRDVRGAVFGHIQDFSLREVGHLGTPSLITRTTNDVLQVQQLTLMTFTLMVTAPIMGVGSVLMALNQSVALSGLLVVVVPVLAVVIALIVSRMRPLFRAMQRRIDRINQVLREQISGVRVVRAFVRDTDERERFGVANDELFAVGLGTGRLMALMFPAVMLIIQLASIAALWFGGHLIGDGSMQIGALIAFLSYLVQVLMAVMMATFMFVMVPRAEACAERICEVLDTAPSVEAPRDPVVLAAPTGRLVLAGVDFGYPGAEEPVLRAVDLVANPGEVTAVIGSTGSGKTTLLNLIPRLFDATAGTVSIDGVDVRRLDGDAISKLIGLVPQRPYLFSGTVASNLRYGNPDASDEELWRALGIAQARDFVEAMPEGLEAPIAQGGSNVSGGQRQRLAIARALVHRPKLYLFDDSFSALDYATDAALRAALSSETADATVLIVAQRVSTIRHADRIVVLERGEVVGTGRHEELMAECATYREIVLSQLSEEEAA